MFYMFFMTFLFTPKELNNGLAGLGTDARGV